MTLRLIEVPGFDSNDFCARWARARLSALRKALNGAWVAEGDSDATTEDRALRALAAAPPDSREVALRAVFDASRALAMSAVRAFGVSWENSDIADLISSSGSPCLRGAWSKKNDAWVLVRNSCSGVGQFGSVLCDYWREAVDGLVSGAGETERFARHESLGHGDSQCLDILYQEIPGELRIRRPQFGELPDEWIDSLRPLTEKLSASGVRLELDGYAEGTIYYRLERSEGSVCGAGGTLLHDMALREFQKLRPGLKAKDSSPVAVIGDSK